MHKINITSFLLLFLSPIGLAQEQIPMGNWRSHFNYEQTHHLLSTGRKIFASHLQGITYYDIEDKSLTQLSRVNGLNDVSVSAMAYDPANKRLVLGYQNGNIDLIDAHGIFNVSGLLANSTTESKKINHIVCYEDKIFVATDFGVLVVDGSSNKINEAYQNLGGAGATVAIRNITTYSHHIYVATAKGVFQGEISPEVNLQDFNNWERFDNSIVSNLDVLSVATANNHVIVATVKDLYAYDQTTWRKVVVPFTAEETINKVKTGVSNLLLFTSKAVYIMNDQNDIQQISFGESIVPNDVVQVGTDDFWVADQELGLTHFQKGKSEHYILNGPMSAPIVRLKLVNDEVYGFANQKASTTKPTNSVVSRYGQGQWVTIFSNEIGNIGKINDVVFNNSSLLFFSNKQGIWDYTNKLHYDQSNSPIQVNIAGAVADQSQNIWIATKGDYSLFKWDKKNKWEKFRFDLVVLPHTIAINTNNQLWITLGVNGASGLLGYDIEKKNYRWMTTSAGLPSNQVNDIAFGQNSELWIATDKGVVFFPYTNGVIDNTTFGVSKVVFENNYLFENKEVTSIAIDGGNRKWMGTQDGLWLFDKHIDQNIYHFTIENSPLPSNHILDIVIHPLSGEVFVATTNGLISYRSDATEGSNTHQQVAIYPNPVPYNFIGSVGFSGLVQDANIKITTVSGRLVREINANGGGAAWDVADYNGRRVNTGIYLVYSSNADGTETFVGKIAVFN